MLNFPIQKFRGKISQKIPSYKFPLNSILPYKDNKLIKSGKGFFYEFCPILNKITVDFTTFLQNTTSSPNLAESHTSKLPSTQIWLLIIQSNFVIPNWMGLFKNFEIWSIPDIKGNIPRYLKDKWLGLKNHFNWSIVFRVQLYILIRTMLTLNICFFSRKLVDNSNL